MLPLAIPTLIKDAPWILLGLALIACAILFGLWKSEESAYANYKVKQADAVREAQERADSLGTQLEAERAKKAAVTERTTVQYVTQLRNAPDDVARLRAIACGLRIVGGPYSTQGPCGSPDALPASNADRKP